MDALRTQPPDRTMTRDERALLVNLGGTLHRLRFWSDPEWEALCPADRPETVVYDDHLRCWVGAVPLPQFNN